MKTTHDEHTYDPTEHDPQIRAREARERAERRKRKDRTISLRSEPRERPLESLRDLC